MSAHQTLLIDEQNLRKFAAAPNRPAFDADERGVDTHEAIHVPLNRGVRRCAGG
jgi:hypothetical protein